MTLEMGGEEGRRGGVSRTPCLRCAPFLRKDPIVRDGPPSTVDISSTRDQHCSHYRAIGGRGGKKELSLQRSLTRKSRKNAFKERWMYISASMCCLFFSIYSRFSFLALLLRSVFRRVTHGKKKSFAIIVGKKNVESTKFLVSSAKCLNSQTKILMNLANGFLLAIYKYKFFAILANLFFFRGTFNLIHTFNIHTFNVIQYLRTSMCHLRHQFITRLLLLKHWQQMIMARKMSSNCSVIGHMNINSKHGVEYKRPRFPYLMFSYSTDSITDNTVSVSCGISAIRDNFTLRHLCILSVVSFLFTTSVPFCISIPHTCLIFFAFPSLSRVYIYTSQTLELLSY